MHSTFINSNVRQRENICNEISLIELELTLFKPNREKNLKSLHAILISTLAITPLTRNDILNVKRAFTYLIGDYQERENEFILLNSFKHFFSNKIDYNFRRDLYKTLNLIQYGLSAIEKCNFLLILELSLNILINASKHNALPDAAVKSAFQQNLAVYENILLSLQSQHNSEKNDADTSHDDSLTYSKLHAQATEILVAVDQKKNLIESLNQQLIHNKQQTTRTGTSLAISPNKRGFFHQQSDEKKQTEGGPRKKLCFDNI